MDDKTLSQAEWKKFAKGRDLQDSALIKSLAVLDRAGSDASARVAALDEVRRQVEALGKSASGNREVDGFLDKLAKAVERQHREARQETSAAALPGDEDEEDTPALLTTRMLPLLRDLRKGERMHALVASAGKAVVVLLSRRAIAVSRRKLLAVALGQTGGIKYFPGECLFEENAHTFVVATAVGGLAKKLRAALLEQTGLRLKVRVRGDDPTQVDADGEDEESAEGEERQQRATPAAEGLLAQLRSGFQALGPRIRQAAEAAGGDSALVDLVAQLRSSLDQGDVARSQGLLKSLARQLLQAGSAADAPEPGAPAASLVALQSARLGWVTTRALLRQRLRTLEMQTLGFFDGLPEIDQARTAVRRMDEVMQELDEDLTDTLDRALVESDPARRRALQADARLCIEDYAAYVRSSPLVAELDANPFTPVDIRDTVLRSIGQLQAVLR